MSNKLRTLDLLDCKILQELDLDARQSLSLIAKKLKTAPETIRYRYASLLTDQVIAFEYAVIDAGQLGSGVHKVLLKLHNVDEAKVNLIIASLVSHERVNWVARFDGIYDVGFTIWVTQLRELSSFMDWLREKYHNFVNRAVFAVNIEAEFFSRDFSFSKKRKAQPQAIYTTPAEPYKFDRIDLVILRMLSKSPRTSNVEIAKAAEVSSETTALRISKLEKLKVISGYRIVLDCARVGWVNYYVFINLKHVSSERREKLVSFCRQHPLVNYLIKALGEWDYELSVEARTLEDYRSLMMELTCEFSEIIKDYYGLPVTKVHKFSIHP